MTMVHPPVELAHVPDALVPGVLVVLFQHWWVLVLVLLAETIISFTPNKQCVKVVKLITCPLPCPRPCPLPLPLPLP